MEVRGTQEAAASLSGGLAMNTSVRTVLWGTTALFGMVVAGAASAADIPLKAPPPAVPWSWAGFYIGAHGGYGWKDNDFTRVVANPPPLFIEGVQSKGGLGGGQAGFNWQFGSVVTGLELDFSAADINGQASASRLNPFAGAVETHVFRDEVKYLGSTRLRLGYSYFPNFLLYGTGGLAWERMDRFSTLSTSGAGTTTARDPIDLFGWVAGAGVEARVADSNWLVRVEYLHYDFDRADLGTDIQIISPGGPNFAERGGHQTIDVVRGALSYKFGVLAQAPEPPRLIGKAPVLPVWSWAGFYLGAHGGYGWKDNDFVHVDAFTPVVTTNGIRSRGWVAGGHAGYNWQFGPVVAGLEADLGAADIKGQSSVVTIDLGNGSTETTSFQDKVKYLGTARARLGYTLLPNFLTYATAGLAWERADRTTIEIFSVSGTGFTTEPRDWFGWVAGAGVEARVGDSNWIARVEYLHYDFGTVEEERTSVGIAPGFPTFAEKGGRQTIDLVRGALSYKFGLVAQAEQPRLIGKAPVIASWNWTGFYLGAHTGHGWKDNDFVQTLGQTPVTTIGGIDSKGWLGGGHGGYNWQYGPVVAGMEIDFSVTDIHGTTDTGVVQLPAFTQTRATTRADDVKDLGSLRARLGTTAQFLGAGCCAGVLFYGTGGLAWERQVQRVAETNTTPAVSDTVITDLPKGWLGWVAGGGVEARVADSNWLVRGEYLHYDFDRVVDSNIFTRVGHQTIDVVRGGLSYKWQYE